MIGDWLAQGGLFLLAVAILFAPGLLVGIAVRMQGLALLAAAPAMSVGLISALAIVFPYVGLRWDMPSVAVAVVAVASALWGTAALINRGRRTELRRRSERTHTLLLIGGLVVGSVLNAARLMSYVGRPDAISQTNDAVFHLNALRWIAESGSASSLDLSGMLGGTTFYPSAWHAVASLVVLGPDQVPVAANMVAVVIAAFVWPLGVAYLARVIAGGRVVAALAAALSAGLLAFPQMMFEWGVLYPYALSLAVLPAVVAVAITTLRAWAGARGLGRWRASAGFLTSTVLGALGIALSQPSSLLVLGLLVLLWVSNRALHRMGGWTIRARIMGLGLLLVAWAMLAGAWLFLAYLAGPVVWRSYRTLLGAVGDVVLNSHAQLPAAFAMSALLIAGIIVAVRRDRWRWFVLSWLIVSVLYVISVGTDLPIVKRALTGPWYGDSFRLAAIVPVVVVPLAALGVAGILQWLRRVTSAARIDRDIVAPILAMAVIAIVGAINIVVAPVVPLRVADETDEESRYAMNSQSYLSTDEFALLRRLPELVPDDALLIGNPSTGAGFAYVIGERDIVPRTWSPPLSQAWHTIASKLRNAAADPEVCPALEAHGGPTHVLDFGPGDEGPGLYLMPGMTGFEGREGFEELASEGDASLWRITACE